MTSNNLEAAEEIVRQLRLRDIGGMIIIDFIDMILPENQDLVLRRLKEALGRDRTRHQVSEVTSLGLVQLTRKRLGTGLVETFSTKCEHCDGRGILLTDDPVDPDSPRTHAPGKHPAAKAMEKRNKKNKSAEELIDAVVAEPDSDDEHEERDDQPKRRSSRRRGRRGSGRGRGRQQEQNQDQNQNERQTETTEQTTTYDEAVAEFERSPRRKRKTRGNSVSDYRPDPKDYDDMSTEDAIDEAADALAFAESANSADSTSDREDSGRDEGRHETQRPAKTSGSRRRRRATRRTSGQQDQKKQPSRAKQEEPKQEASISKSSRGRRRATRKSR